MEITIVGIRHAPPFKQMGKDAGTAAADSYLKTIPIGTEVILKKEPDNIADHNAIAVYVDFDRRIGYVTSPQIHLVQGVLDEYGEAVGVLARVDHITSYVEVPDAKPDSVSDMLKPRDRKLPLVPLADSVYLSGTEEEHSLGVVIRHFFMTEINCGNAETLYTLAKKLLPKVGQSICEEESQWSREALSRLQELNRQSATLGYSDEKRAALAAIEHDFKEIVSSFVAEGGREAAFEKRYESLKKLANEGNGFFSKYIDAYLGGSLENAPSAQKMTEYARFRQWLRDLPFRVFKAERIETHKVADELFYYRISRQEEIDIISVLLLLELLEPYCASNIQSAALATLKDLGQRLMREGKNMPKDLMKPYLAAFGVGAISEMTCDELNRLFGSRIPSSSFSEWKGRLSICDGRPEISKSGQDPEFTQYIQMFSSLKEV